MGNKLCREKKQNKRFALPQWHKVVLFLVVYDAFVMAISYFLALWIRFDCQMSEIPEVYLTAWLSFTPIYTILSFLVFWKLHLYQSIWRFASYTELKRVIYGSVITAVLHTVGITVLFKRMPISYYMIGTTVQFILVLSVRFSYRFVNLERTTREKLLTERKGDHVMLIGAGSAGQMVLRDLHSNPEVNSRVYCIIDDDPKNWGRYIEGVPVVGGRDDILENVEKYEIDKIFLAIPSATAIQRKEILEICKETECETKNLPRLSDLVAGRVTVSSLKDVNVEDLLGREPVMANMYAIRKFISGKTVLVTGGGGSIGSELCRQVAQNKPKKLIVFDIYENNAHAIGLELRDKYPDLDLEVLIGSVRDSKRINQVFAKYKPDIVYHAAAHKHVPLMEDSPCESIKNNAIGTYKTAYAAMTNGCRRFVLISTDKAVNPTNIMGASKRLCEMIIQSFDKKIRDGKFSDLRPIQNHTEDGENTPKRRKRVRTRFVAVRFGNVLGSNGSVIPRFKEQIAKGGPVTVTHPDIIRYFMTIPEAATLVLQAGTYANGGEIFVLDMGQPVKIDTLARNLIRLSGLQPDVDIPIVYTGLRVGEKLYEEKLMSEEGLRTTPNKRIHIGSPVPFDTDVFMEQLQKLMEAAYEGREDVMCDLVAKVVPTYHPEIVKDDEHQVKAYQ
ncbi:MAG: polysaccharide biosynthesis protein [Ruminococcaceae bacterium]|nr:polysaccharide biosynthesis protein [Oscillospiraceae bacterium]